MGEPDFWNCRGEKRKIFCNKQELLAYCIDDVNVLRQAHCAFRYLVLKLVKIDPIRQAINKPSICNKVSGTRYCRYYPERVVPNGRPPVCCSPSMVGVHWSTRNNVTHAVNGREVHWPGVPNVKVDGYCKETKEVFKYLGCLWHGCQCMPNRHKPTGNTEVTAESV